MISDVVIMRSRKLGESEKKEPLRRTATSSADRHADRVSYRDKLKGPGISPGLSNLLRLCLSIPLRLFLAWFRGGLVRLGSGFRLRGPARRRSRLRLRLHWTSFRRRPLSGL